MKRLFIVALTVLVIGAGLSLAQEGAPKAKVVDKSSPELMLKKGAGAPKPTPAAAGIAVGDEGVPANKPPKKGTK